MIETPAYDLVQQAKHSIKVNHDSFLSDRQSNLLQLSYLDEDDSEREQEEYDELRMVLPEGADSIVKNQADEREKAEDVMNYPQDGTQWTETGSVDINDIDR